jgi:Spy/CpxP family protein refolding chaperone
MTMRKFLALGAVVALSLASAATLAADTAAADSAGLTQKPKKKLICKLEKPVGSQMVKRICMTEEQAQAERDSARGELERAAVQMRR